MPEHIPYQGDVNLYPPALETLDKTDFDRLVYLEELNPVLLLNFQKHVMKTLEILVKSSNQKGQRYKLITGFTGTGKSTLLRAFSEKHPPTDLELAVISSSPCCDWPFTMRRNSSSSWCLVASSTQKRESDAECG